MLDSVEYITLQVYQTCKPDEKAIVDKAIRDFFQHRKEVNGRVFPAEQLAIDWVPVVLQFRAWYPHLLFQ